MLRFLHNQLMKAWTTLSHTGRVELTLIPFGKARCIEKGNDFEYVSRLLFKIESFVNIDHIRSSALFRPQFHSSPILLLKCGLSEHY